VLVPPPRCCPPTPSIALAGGIQRPTPKVHRPPTPNAQRPEPIYPQRPTPKVHIPPTPNPDHPTPYIEHPTPKKIPSAPRCLLIWAPFGPRRDPVGYSGDRRRPGAFVTPISRAAAARSRGGVRAGATRNRRWESDPTPFWGVTRGRPCRPPNAQRPAAASPALHLAQRRAYHRGAHERGFRTLYRSRSKVASSPVNAPGVALPHAQRPTPKRPQRPTPNAQRPTPNAQRPRDPNAQETPTPNAKVVNPFGWSTAQLCRCYGLPQTPFVDPQDARPRRRHP
jgi:hypothetical protein